MNAKGSYSGDLLCFMRNRRRMPAAPTPMWWYNRIGKSARILPIGLVYYSKPQVFSMHVYVRCSVPNIYSTTNKTNTHQSTTTHMAWNLYRIASRSPLMRGSPYPQVLLSMSCAGFSKFELIWHCRMKVSSMSSPTITPSMIYFVTLRYTHCPSCLLLGSGHPQRHVYRNVIMLLLAPKKTEAAPIL